MIDRKKVIKALEHCEFGGSDPCCEKECPYYQIHDCTDELKYNILALLREQNDCENCAIAIEDRQPVVRCKDCKHYRINTVYPGTNMIMKYCAKTGIAENKPDWFCADGERQ